MNYSLHNFLRALVGSLLVFGFLALAPFAHAQFSGSDATFGGGTDATFGGGSDATFGGGSDATFGGGSDATFGGGTDATFGGGSDATFGGGSDATFGGGTDATFGGGSDATFGSPIAYTVSPGSTAPYASSYTPPIYGYGGYYPSGYAMSGGIAFVGPGYIAPSGGFVSSSANQFTSSNQSSNTVYSNTTVANPGFAYATYPSYPSYPSYPYYPSNYYGGTTCYMSLSANNVPAGTSVTLYWSSQNATSGFISGIGNVPPSGSTVLNPYQNLSFTGTFYGPGGSTNCYANVNVGGSQAPYVTLNQVPYTGLDLGPVGTALYWLFLVLWCAIAAYLIAVKKFHNTIFEKTYTLIWGKPNAITHPVYREVHGEEGHSPYSLVAPKPLGELPTAQPTPSPVDHVDDFITAQIAKHQG